MTTGLKKVICLGAVFISIVIIAVLIICNNSKTNSVIIEETEQPQVTETTADKDIANNEALDSNTTDGDSTEQTEKASTSEESIPQAKDDGIYKIAFYDFEKKVILSEDVKSGESIVPPENIDTPYGYVFIGWDKPLDNITSDERINAQFTEIKDKENAFYINSKGGKRGRKISVKVELGGKVNLCGANMDIKYDNEKLKFVKFKNEDKDVMVEHNKENGTVSFNIIANENISGDVEMFEIEFKSIGDSTGNTELIFDNAEVVRFEGNDIVPADYYPVNGSIYIY